MAIHTAEPAINALLALALDQRHPRWDVYAEQTRVLRGDPSKKPDIVIMPRGRAGEPVVIETEYAPAAKVEEEAVQRLGSVLALSGHEIEQVVAVRIPEGLDSGSVNDIFTGIASAEFEYILLRGTPQVPPRFPETGWISGSVNDLAGFCERITLNQRLLDDAVKLMERTADSVAENLRDALQTSPQSVLTNMASHLHQSDDPQTTRMAIAVIASALLFQSAIEGRQHGPIAVPMTSATLDKTQVLNDWETVLDINYFPIFAISKELLAEIPAPEAREVISTLTEMVHSLAGLGVTSTGEMAGQMFGKLIADRKFLATFYTRPESASLLAELAMQRLDLDHDWSDQTEVEALRIADLACGTGTLLTAAYQRIASRVRRASVTHSDGCDGRDDAAMHPVLVEKALIGADIMPAAVHLTSMLLASMHPSVTFDDSGVHLMPYGDRGTGAQIGSLELLDSTFQRSINLGASPQRITGVGVRSESELDATTVIPHNTADLVIMNPPFTRTTNHAAAAANVPLPAFAGFNTSHAEQTAMSKRLKQLRGEDAAGHGNVGLASDFFDLAHAKAKPGGTIAFVLPLTVISGEDWQGTRDVLSREYGDICVVAIAAAGAASCAFSADTNIAEVLIVATKSYIEEKVEKVLFVNLLNRPANMVEAVEIARHVGRIDRRDEYGTVQVGDDQAGIFTWAYLSDGGCAGVVELDLMRCARSMNGAEA